MAILPKRFARRTPAIANPDDGTAMRPSLDLVTHWQFKAPATAVWAALARPEQWPQWWPYVQLVQWLHRSGGDEVGSRLRIHWRTRLLYGFAIELEVVERIPFQRLRAKATGQLEGEGIWLIQSQGQDEGERTLITYVWRVQLKSAWMRLLAPLLARAFRWNHEAVMQAGQEGLQRWLDAGGGQ